jgi:FAD:protein FMN transferase
MSFVHHPFFAMGCHMQIVTVGDGDSSAVTLAIDAFAQWESVLSRFLPDSELNTLSLHPNQWRRCSPVLWDVLVTADWAWRFSDGLIDPTIRANLEAYGYDQTFAAITSTQITHAVPVSGWQQVKLDHKQQQIWLPLGVRFDLAGVAKSWAAQQALQLLRSFPAAAIDAAGDIVVWGTPPADDAWPIDIEPLPGYAAPAMLALTPATAIATSGRDQRQWRRADGTQAHHIIDPRTGAPTQSDVVRASVIAPTLVGADVAARTLVILGQQAGFAWLAQHPYYAALLHLTDGHTVMSPMWQLHLWDTQNENPHEP